MKLKREIFELHSKLSNTLKWGVSVVLFLLVTTINSQTISIVATPGMADENGTNDSFTISRIGGVSPGSLISFAISGDATPVDDFTSITGSANLVTGTITLPAGGNVSAIITVSGIVDDDLVEGSEDIIITLTGVLGGGIIGPQDSAISTINDNDTGTFTVNTLDAVAVEETPGTTAGEARFRIELDKENATGNTVTLPYTFAPAPTNGADASDYVVVGQALLSFPAGITARTLRIQPNDDAIPESDEELILTLGVPSNNVLFAVGSPNTGSATIEDNDCIAGTTAPPLNNATPTELCDVASVNLNTYVTGGGPSAPPGAALRWSLIPNPTVSGDLIATTASDSDTYYGVYWDNINSCASPSLEVEITFSESPSAGTTTNASACNNNDDDFGPNEIDLDDLISDEDNGDWSQSAGPSVGAIPNNNEIDFANRPAGVYEFTYTTTGAVAPCVNSSSTVTITVADCNPCTAGNLAPALNSNQTVFCGPIPASVELTDYAPNTGPGNNPLKWSSSQTDPIPNIVSNGVVQDPGPGTYYGFYHDEVNDCASPTVALTLISNPVPAINSTTNDERCGPGVVNLTASVSLNATINWYLSATSNTILGSGSNFAPNVSQTTTYWVEATLNGCTSEREAVVATVVPQPSAGTLLNGGNASACSDGSNGPTIVDLDDLITGEDAGGWSFTSGPLGENITIPTNNIIDFANRGDGDYVFTYTTSGAEAPCLDESAILTISVNDCDIDSDLDGLFDGPEATLGTDPNDPDSDGDGVNDADEVGGDIDNPLDEDDDGIIDALDSNIADTDLDGVVDQLDPANMNPCIPNTLNGVCDSDGDDIPDSDEITGNSDPLDPCDPNTEHPNCNPEPIDLEVLKDVDNINAQIGDTVVFTITVRNTDLVRKAINIIIGDLLDTGFEYISHDAPTENYDPETGEWQIPEILATEEAVLNITVLVLEDGTYVNTAELLDSFPMDDTLANNEATVTLPIVLPEGIDLVLEKTALSENPLVGDEVIFTIKLINASIDELPVTNIEVEDIISADNGFVYIDSNPSLGQYDSATGIWSIESLNKGQEVTLEIRVGVPNVSPVGIPFTNTATIIRSSPADGNPLNNVATAEVNVRSSTPVDVGIIYNQFSPNGDGTNDVLKINFFQFNEDGTRGNEILNRLYNIQIFNRYGNLVFEANNKSDTEVWDGTWKGKDAPDGTYFYTLSIDVGNGAESKKGWIQLLR